MGRDGSERKRVERAMKPAAQRMVAELLGRQLGVDAGELAGAFDGDPMTAILTLSMMSRSAGKRNRCRRHRARDACRGHRRRLQRLPRRRPPLHRVPRAWQARQPRP